MLKKIRTKLFSTGVKAVPLSESVVQLSVQFSFEASAQVGFKDGENRLRIKRFKAKSWQTEFVQGLSVKTPVELRTFIYTPHLTQAQQVTLTISINNQVVKQQDFVIPVEADYAGWFTLSYLPSSN